MYYYLDWARWLVAKTHRPLCSIKKRRLPLISRLIQDTLVSKKRRDYTGEYTFFSYIPLLHHHRDLRKTCVGYYSRFPRISPDGRFLVFVKPESIAYGDLVLYDTARGQETVLSKGSELSLEQPLSLWSADSAWMVYASHGDLYYYSLDQHREGRVVDIRHPDPGAGRREGLRHGTADARRAGRDDDPPAHALRCPTKRPTASGRRPSVAWRMWRRLS